MRHGLFFDLDYVIISRCKTHIQTETLFCDFTSENTVFLALVCEFCTCWL